VGVGLCEGVQSGLFLLATHAEHGLAGLRPGGQLNGYRGISEYDGATEQCKSDKMPSTF